jgi:ABC-type taurine transport system substrate-binding protein
MNKLGVAVMKPQELNINSEIGIAAAIEAKRLAEKYDKDFLDCDDLVKIMGVGKNNVRQLLNSDSFPTVEIGNRKVVSVIAFALWSLQAKSQLA